jgi:hypothetical protein
MDVVTLQARRHTLKPRATQNRGDVEAALTTQQDGDLQLSVLGDGAARERLQAIETEVRRFRRPWARFNTAGRSIEIAELLRRRDALRMRLQ